MLKLPSQLGLITHCQHVIRIRGRPRQIWIGQLEVDVGRAANAASDIASDGEVWRAHRPVAGQTAHRVTPGFHHTVAVLPLVDNQSAFWSLHPYVNVNVNREIFNVAKIA